MNSLKNLLILIVILLAGNRLFSQGMPIDKTTNKVTYSGEVTFPSATFSKDIITDKIATFLTGYTQFRGSINSVYINSDKSRISGVISIFPTSSAKSMQWFVNAAFTINVTDNSFKYTITDMYAYASTVAYVYGNDVNDGPIESSDGFNVVDFKMKNKNAETTHNCIIKIIDDLSQSALR
jgi:hypothetical protein